MMVVSSAFSFLLFSTAGKEISPLLLSITQEVALEKRNSTQTIASCSNYLEHIFLPNIMHLPEEINY